MADETDVANVAAQAGAGVLGESGQAEVVVAPEVAKSPDFKGILASAPTLHEVLARPMVYEDWLKKAQEALNG